MNQLSLAEAIEPQISNCAELMAMAERELTAFFHAATKLFGVEQARLAAEDWLRELATTEDLPDTTKKWRSVTLGASGRLAARTNG